MAHSLADMAIRTLEPHAGKKEPTRPRVPASQATGGQLAILERAGWEAVGLVCGAAVFHVGLAGWPRGNVEMTRLSAAMYSARERALASLQKQSGELGGSGVIDTALDVHFMRDHRHLPRFVAVGTAVARSRTEASAVQFVQLLDAGYQPLGLVMGSCVYHVGRRAFSEWAEAQTHNSEMTNYTAALDQARGIAMERLQQEAARHRADGVVGVSTAERSHAWGSHVIEFFAMGTAVRYDPPDKATESPLLAVSLNDPVVQSDPAAITGTVAREGI